MSQQLITQKASEDINKQRQNLVNWLKLAHEEPRKVAVNKFANNTKYVPVSYVEMKLDELFIDGWNLEIKEVKQVLNAVMVVVRISGINPATGREFFRDGVGSKALQLKKNSPAMDIASIQPNACELAFPAAKTQALKNAAQSIGKVFGRDISRELEDEYQPIIKTEEQLDAVFIRCREAWEKSDKTDITRDKFILEAKKHGIQEMFVEYLKGNK